MMLTLVDEFLKERVESMPRVGSCEDCGADLLNTHQWTRG